MSSGAGETNEREAAGRAALGYLRKHLLMTDTEVMYAKERLAYFAELEGLELGTVYVEEIESWPRAFEALVHAAVKESVTAVVVPSMLHFAVIGPATTVKDHFEYTTRTRVLSASDIVSYEPGTAAS